MDTIWYGGDMSDNEMAGDIGREGLSCFTVFFQTGSAFGVRSNSTTSYVVLHPNKPP